MEYVIIGIVLIIIALVVIKMSRPEFKYEANKLVENLGGIKNIIHMEVSVSRFKVTVKDPSLVNKDVIKKIHRTIKRLICIYFVIFIQNSTKFYSSVMVCFF